MVQPLDATIVTVDWRIYREGEEWLEAYMYMVKLTEREDLTPSGEGGNNIADGTEE